jgi:hypothetical protein
MLRILAKMAKPEPAKCSDTTCIFIGLRRSGLSVPYQSIASLVGDARPDLIDGAPPPNSWKTPFSTGSIVWNTSSCSTKDISMSSW